MKKKNEINLMNYLSLISRKSYFGPSSNECVKLYQSQYLEFVKIAKYEFELNYMSVIRSFI